jgi:hypothetical protein
MAERPGASTSARRWTRAEVIVVVAGLLLAGDLLALPWHHYHLDLGNLGVQVPIFDLRRTGVQSPQAAFGVAAMVLALGMALHISLTKLSATLPRLVEVHLVAGAVTLGLVLAKLLADRDFLGTGAWAGTALALGLAYGGFALSQEAVADPAPEG